MKAPKPAVRDGRVSLWQYFKLFRQDILSAQPERLYRAKMAEFRAPFLQSVLVNDPDLVREVLIERSNAFPKSIRQTAGLKRLLGQSVFVTNGDLWTRQRRIVDQCFGAEELKRVFPAMVAAAEEAAVRLPHGTMNIEPEASRAAADVIFRTLFSIPIDDQTARNVYDAFHDFARAQPLLTPAAFFRWLPPFHRQKTRVAAARVRETIKQLVTERAAAIAEACAPDDLATRLMTATDPETGDPFSSEDALDQVAIFFLAGHETSAAALGWALYLVAGNPDIQEKIANDWHTAPAPLAFRDLSRLTTARDVFRETLRLYPPVPMMVRDTDRPEVFRKRQIRRGAQVVISPWHIHRHEDYWTAPDDFVPSRWSEKPKREHYLPFSAGPRVCPGASFAMAEGVVLLSSIIARHHIDQVNDPVPVAHLTTRSKSGIVLRFRPRA